MSTNTLSGKPLWSLAAIFGALTVLVHIPFVIRYDLYFQSGIAVEALQCKRMCGGELSLYTWATDYGGLSPIQFFGAALFRIFGFSIPLAGLVSLITWALGIALLVGYVAACLGKRAGIGAGISLAVGMPFFLMYSTQYFRATYDHMPLFIGGFLWLTTLSMRRGPQSRLSVLIAFLMGWCWYMNKQVLVVWASIGIVLLLLPEGRKYMASFLRSRFAIFAAIAFLVGYSPELLYKIGFFDHAGRQGDSSSFFSLAAPDLMLRNWYMMFRSIPTYFDADPWSRMPEGVHYLNHMENWESFPLHASDTIGIIGAFLVIGYMLQSLVNAYKEKNLALLLLTAIPVVSAIMIVTAAKSGASYYNIRRYLLPSGILFVTWLGVRLSHEITLRRWAISSILGLTLLISAFHQVELLDAPDQLVDYRRTIDEIEKGGFTHGLSWYSFSPTLTALCNERVIFGVIDFSIQSPYQGSVLAQDELAIVWPARSAPPFEFAQQLFFGGVKFRDDAAKVLPERVSFFGQNYVRTREPRIVGELGWAPYRKAP
ncbi:MAG: hypothetical protein WCS70_06155 [Verrucomicrobiota bacterium]